MVLLYAVLGFLAGVVLVGVGWRWASRRRPLPCPSSLAWLLENPLTELQAGTQTTLERIGLRPGETALDVGCGPGRLTIPAAHQVGPTGTIVALDSQTKMLERLQQRAARAGATNIVLQLGDIATDSRLRAESFDRAWMVTVLGEIPNRQAALRRLHRALKPGGTLSITEIFPDPHYQTRATVLRLCRQAGFEPDRYWGSWLAFTQNVVKPG